MNEAKLYPLKSFDLWLSNWGLENYGRSVGEEDEREDIEYNHVCKQCNHVISQHKVRIVYFLIFMLFSVNLEWLILICNADTF